MRRLYIDSRWIEVSGEGYLPEGEFSSDGQKLNPENEPALAQHLRIGALCNDAVLTMEDEKCCSIFGDPTEGALVVTAGKAGMSKEKLEKAFPRLDEIPFQSEKLYMATFHPREGGRVAYVKGATEKILSLSKYQFKGGKIAPLDETDVQSVMQANETMAGEAMRVMATAYVDLPGDLMTWKMSISEVNSSLSVSRGWPTRPVRKPGKR